MPRILCILSLLLPSAALAQTPQLVVTGGTLGQNAVYTLNGTLTVMGVPEVLAIDVANIPGGIFLGSLGVLELALTPALALLSGNGTHTWTLPVPNDPTIAGATFYAQGLGFVYDPFTFSGAFKLSNLATLTLSAGQANVPRFAYVTNQVDNTVSIYVQEAASGQLRHDGYVFLGSSTGPRALAVSPNGAFVYVACTTSSQVFAYSADAKTGQLKPAGSPIASGGTSPNSLAVDPTGKYLYVVNGTGGIGAYAINSGTGVLATIAGSPYAAGTAPGAIALDPSGKFAYVANGGSDNISAFGINSATGALAGVAGSPFLAGDSPAGLAVTSGGGFLYCSNAGTSDSVSGFAINSSTGALTPVAGSPFPSGNDPAAISLDPAGTFLYTANTTANTISVYTIAAGTGVLGAGAAVGTGTAPLALDVDPAGAYVYVINLGDAEIRSYSIGSGGALNAAAPFEVRTRNGPTSIVVAPASSAASFVTNALYVANRDSNDVSQYSVNTLNGSVSGLSPAQVGSSPTANAIEVHPFLDFAYLTSFISGGASIDIFNLSSAGNLSPAGAADTQQGNWATYIEPSGRFAYMTGGPNPGRVTPYAINQSTGALTPGASSSAGSFPRGGAVHPNGKYFYTTNQFGDSISGFQLDPATGALSALSPATVATGTGPIALAVDPTGRFAYAVNQGATDSISMYSVNAGTGVLSPLTATAPTVGIDPVDVAVAPNGRFAYVANRGSSSISGFFANVSPTNGFEDGSLAPLPAPTTVIGGPPRALAIDASGTHLYVSIGSDNVAGTIETYSISAAGVLTLVDTDAAGIENRGLAVRRRIQ